MKIMVVKKFNTLINLIMVFGFGVFVESLFAAPYSPEMHHLNEEETVLVFEV